MLIAFGSYFLFIMFVLGTIAGFSEFSVDGELICDDTKKTI